MSLLLKKCLAETKIDISHTLGTLETLETFDTFGGRGHFGWVQDILDFLDILDLSVIMDILGHCVTRAPVLNFITSWVALSFICEWVSQSVRYVFTPLFFFSINPTYMKRILHFENVTPKSSYNWLKIQGFFFNLAGALDLNFCEAGALSWN